MSKWHDTKLFQYEDDKWFYVFNENSIIKDGMEKQGIELAITK